MTLIGKKDFSFLQGVLVQLSNFMCVLRWLKSKYCHAGFFSCSFTGACCNDCPSISFILPVTGCSPLESRKAALRCPQKERGTYFPTASFLSYWLRWSLGDVVLCSFLFGVRDRLNSCIKQHCASVMLKKMKLFLVGFGSQPDREQLNDSRAGNTLRTKTIVKYLLWS